MHYILGGGSLQIFIKNLINISLEGGICQDIALALSLSQTTAFKSPCPCITPHVLFQPSFNDILIYSVSSHHVRPCSA